ncbi:MAG: wax ester/triacylglycerol synthase family O-acyltransferase [Gammaproteobacteria bacterium]|uniref:WS/DGAT/MGAT family O-acyltransferase n=1 Tax=Nevskia sp. TaxID=1929292 RepID=UPI0040375D78|nr:wax ester/triacylglycerol synthase family O-acyltransferase [Gammaproteobacteria bacterium]
MATLLKPLDASWLYVESRTTPMHVAGLNIFSLPDDAPPDFLVRLVAQLKDAKSFSPPWNLRLKASLLKSVAPAWEIDDGLDLDYHVRHSALPHPGGERELGVLVSRLHSHELDLNRPLWECHVIEGLENRRFALYIKIHHALIDGVGGIRLTARAFSTSPSQRGITPPWSIGTEMKKRRARRDETADNTPPPSTLDRLREQLAQQVELVPQVFNALTKIWSGKKPHDALATPFKAPKSVLNDRVDGQRRFATQQYDLARLKAITEKAGVTLNDVVLAICAGALRRFLKELNALPRRSLTAGLPVSVRPKGDLELGTAISFMLADLGTSIADPVKRLHWIHESTLGAKEHLQSLPKSGLNNYTTLFMAPYIMGILTGAAGRIKPMFNLAISNVPGPDQTLYLGGAKLEAMYPVSVLMHGQALNITCLSYAGKLNFGFTGARDALPHMQRLAVYTGEALDELETAVQKAFR